MLANCKKSINLVLLILSINGLLTLAFPKYIESSIELKYELYLTTCSKIFRFNDELSNILVWVKIISSWFCFLIYEWTLIAPAVLQDREFS